MVKPYFERAVKKHVMATDYYVENDSNQESEAWGDTPDVEGKCKIRLSKSEILTDLDPTY